jgi:hypothetical protein
MSSDNRRAIAGRDAIRTIILTALIGIASSSLSQVCAEQSRTSPRGPYTDVFAFCSAVRSTPPSDETKDRRYAGQDPPKAVVYQMETKGVIWRCQDGEVYGCETGASGRNCRHVTAINTPDDAVREFCAGNPDADFVPNVANYTASSWQCKGRVPVIAGNSPPDEVDKYGYISGAWLKITQDGPPIYQKVPKSPFLTGPGSPPLCQHPFSIKEAKAALAAGDRGWFEKTGCVQAQFGLRVVLIEAPLLPNGHGGSSPSSELPWRGRVYLRENEENGANVYFDPGDIITYALATSPYEVPLPPGPPGWNLPKLHMMMSGDRPIEFKTLQDAERWYSQNIADYAKPGVPHGAVPDNGAFKLVLGPATYGLLDTICSHGKPSCHVVGQLPH